MSSAFDFIPENALTKALGIDAMKKKISKAVADSIISEKLTDNFRNFGDKAGEIARNHWGKIIGGALAIGLGIFLLTKLAEQTDQIGEKFGSIGVTEFRGDLMAAHSTAVGLGYDFDEMTSSVVRL